MAISLLNNISALEAQNQLNITQSKLQNTLFQLSSGSRINSGADDAAGLAIANGLQANVTALTQSQQNANTGVGSLQVADGALAQVTTLLNRAVTLATESANGTLNGDNGTQRTALDAEYTQIKAEIDSIGANTTFNGTGVFQGSSANSLQSASATLTTASTTGASAGNLVFDVGGQQVSFAVAANQKIGDVINMINNSGKGLQAAIVGTTAAGVTTGRLVVTDSQNRNDIALDGATSGTVATALGASGTTPAMAAPIQTQANLNAIQFAQTFADGDVVDQNTTSAENLVLDAGTQKYTFALTGGTTTIGTLMNEINSAGDNLQAALVGGKLTITDLSKNSNISMDTSTDAAVQTALGGAPTNPTQNVTGGGFSVFLSDSTAGGTSKINMTIGALASSNVGGVDLSSTSLSTQAGAQSALTQINAAISAVAAVRGNIGAGINRLQAASNVESVQVQNLTSAQDQITAANIPQQVTNLSEYSILNQSGISALAQANSAQQSILKLLQ